MVIPNNHFSTLKSKVFLAFIVFFVALSVRLSYQKVAVINGPIRSDAYQYYFTAYNLYNHGVYSIEDTIQSKSIPQTLWRRTPGYPLFLYPFFSFSRSTTDLVNNVSIAQAFLGSLTCAFVFLLGLLFLPIPWAATAGLLTALSPHLVAIDDYFLSESLFTFTIVAASLMFAISLKKRNPGYPFVGGILFCYLALIRAVSGLLGPFMILLFVILAFGWKSKNNKLTLIVISSFILGMLLIHIPYSSIRQ